MPNTGVPANFHGVKGRSGRKPLAATLLKRKLEEEKRVDADRAFSFLVAVMDSEDEPTAIRLEAADKILDRVIGKATQRLDQKIDATLNDWRAGKDADEIAAIEEAARIVNAKTRNTSDNID